MPILTPYVAARIAYLLGRPPNRADAAERQRLIELLDPPEGDEMPDPTPSRLQAVKP
jgi:hypothetical protein